MRALISVSSKEGIVEFGHALMTEHDAIVVSTGKTYDAISVDKPSRGTLMKVSDITGFPEIMDGRVKTLHPTIFAGILARRDNPDDMAAIERLACPPIDIVVVNLYPFQATADKEGVTHDELIENIDIGGPSLVRAAAKNFKDVIVVVDPWDYPEVLRHLREDRDDLQFRANLALKAFRHTADYDTAISTELHGWITMDGVSFVRTAEIC
ncbi:hypothetical protein HY629_01360 [Candidatus Uhrbacteria bacterium]|nr:hypothetical protein [Candidatus Uhrbacteria bacterium]